MQEATEMLKEVDLRLKELNEVAAPLTGEEQQPLTRLGQLLEAFGASESLRNGAFRSISGGKRPCRPCFEAF